MIRKIIYTIGILSASLFLIWLNFLAVKDCIIPHESNYAPMGAIVLFTIEGVALISALIAILCYEWENIWCFIDKKDDEIKKYLETKKKVSSEGSLSMSGKEKEGSLSHGK